MSDPVEIPVPCSSSEHYPKGVEKRAESIVSVLLSHLSDATSANLPTLDRLAELLNLSACHLQHIIKEETGISFSRHVKILRMQRARKLLQETCLTVKQVMIEVGISDHSHFAKDYKKHFGESPTLTRCAAIASGKKLTSCVQQQNTCNGAAKPAVENHCRNTDVPGIRLGAEGSLADRRRATFSSFKGEQR